MIFHPVDTIAKRLMSNKAKVCPPCSSLFLSFFLTVHRNRPPPQTSRPSSSASTPQRRWAGG